MSSFPKYKVEHEDLGATEFTQNRDTDMERIDVWDEQKPWTDYVDDDQSDVSDADTDIDLDDDDNVHVYDTATEKYSASTEFTQVLKANPSSSSGLYSLPATFGSYYDSKVNYTYYEATIESNLLLTTKGWFQDWKDATTVAQFDVLLGSGCAAFTRWMTALTVMGEASYWDIVASGASQWHETNKADRRQVLEKIKEQRETWVKMRTEEEKRNPELAKQKSDQSHGVESIDLLLTDFPAVANFVSSCVLQYIQQNRAGLASVEAIQKTEIDTWPPTTPLDQVPECTRFFKLLFNCDAQFRRMVILSHHRFRSL